MNRLQRMFRTITPAAVLLLAACSSGGDGGAPDPDPGTPDPGRPIRGTVTAPEAGHLSGVTIDLCPAGSGCASVLASRRPAGMLGRSASFEFRNVPGGSYDVHAWNEVLNQDGKLLGHDEAVARNVQPGTTDVHLQLEFSPEPRSDGLAAISGVLHLPGGLSGADAGESSGPLTMTGQARRVAAGTAAAPAPKAAARTGSPEVMPGEIIVRFSSGGLGPQSLPASLSSAGAQLRLLAAGTGGHLYSDPSLSAEETVRLAAELAGRPGIVSAVPNRMLHAFRVPDDEHYPLQWHFEAIGLPAAWDLETGSAGVTVAVVDSGSISHPDLRFTGGYDFITDAGLSGDGSGRDSDPTDPGLGSDYHGAHVAGTIGALTDNGRGVAGISWNVDLVPVRTLGVNGKGTLFDVLDGVAWAAGRHIPGVPENDHPADVINLSLGVAAGSTCSEMLGGDDAFFEDLTRATGAVIVVAAGNEGIDTAGVFPANCPGVITTGATGRGNDRAPYSNHGREVDIMAPGGDLNAAWRHGGREYPLGVLSTVLDSTGRPDYAFFQGTSMAAPHVSGVIALLLSHEPGLGFEEVLDRLVSGAGTAVCASGCGAGLLNAEAVLRGTAGGTPAPEPPADSDVMTYIMLSACSDSTCDTAEPHTYIPFGNVPPGDVRYLADELGPGRYRVEAWQDLNGNSDPENRVWGIDPGEPYFRLPNPVRLRENETVTGIDIDLRTGLGN